jgi:hypothetical protein
MTDDSCAFSGCPAPATHNARNVHRDPEAGWAEDRALVCDEHYDRLRHGTAVIGGMHVEYRTGWE